MHGVDPHLVAAIMWHESRGKPYAVSRAGARGLMQVMPLHACVDFAVDRNIDCGVSILVDYVSQADGDLRSGLAAYNAGPTGRDKRGLGWGYADDVLRTYTQYAAN